MAETFTYQPTKNSRPKKEPRTKGAQFGNGYQQIYGDGINANLEQWDLEFKGDEAEMLIVDSFLDDHGGYTFFNWTSPLTGATEKQYLCPRWQGPSPIGGGFFVVTATFREYPGLV